MTGSNPYECLGPLSTVTLDRARLPLPADWETGSDPGLRWAAAPDRRFALERRTRWTPLDGADWDGAVRARAAAFLTAKGWDEMVETIRAAPMGPLFNLRFLDAMSDRPGYAAWHWLALNREGDGVTEAVYTFYIASGQETGPEAEALMAVLTAALAEAPPHPPAAIGSLDSGFGLDRMRPMTVFDRYTLCVPARWHDEYQVARKCWLAGEDQPNTGSLWVRDQIYSYSTRADAHTVWERLGKGPTEGAKGRRYGARRLETGCTDRGALYLTFQTAEKGETLVYHHWELAHLHGPLIVTVYFDLVLDPSQMAKLEFRNLVSRIEYEVVHCIIGGLDAWIERAEQVAARPSPEPGARTAGEESKIP